MIPKQIYQSWYTTTLHPSVEKKINDMKNINPGYNHKIYTDAEIDSFINENFQGEIADCYNKLNIIVAKVDFWRYLILYKYGGIYLDMDSSINKPLDELIKDSDDAIITVEKNKDMFVQWALMFNKEHPILKKTIELIVENIKFNKYPNNIHKTTGPSVFSDAINIIHNAYNGRKVRHNLIHNNFDMTFKCYNRSYRLYSIDYNGYLSFKHDASEFLYNSKKHWREEEKQMALIL
jgi:mannosyltransferase OCH1-like enzyme